MRSRLARLAPALAIALVLALAASSPAFADSVGKIIAIVSNLFGGQIVVSNPVANQVLLYNASGQLVNGTAPAGPTTSPWSTVLANGNTTAGQTPTISSGDQILATNGSNTVPFLALSAQTNTGLYGSANNLDFSVAGSQVFGLNLRSSNSQFFSGLQVNPLDTRTTTSPFLQVAGTYTVPTIGTVSGASISNVFGDGGVSNSTVVQGLLVSPSFGFTAASKSGHYEGITVNAVENGNLPTGTNYLLRLQAGATGGLDKLRCDNVGQLSIGSSSQTLLNGLGVPSLAVISPSGGTGLFLETYGTPAAFPGGGANMGQLASYHARGSTGAPAAVQNGDALLYVQGGGWWGSAFHGDDIGIIMEAAETWSSGTNMAGSRMTFVTSPTGGGAANGSKRWSIQPAGDLIGTSALVHGWASSTDPTAASDTSLSRDSAGVIDAGTGAQSSKGGFFAASGFSVGNGTPVATAGTVSWVAGLGVKTASAPHEIGPTDQDFFVSGAAARSLTLTGPNGVNLNGGTNSGIGSPASVAGGSASGVNNPGGNISMVAGTGTGTGGPSQITFFVAPLQASGSTQQTSTNVAGFFGAQNNLSGTAAIGKILATFADAGTTSTTAAQGLSIALTYNYTAASRTGSTLDFLINRTETSLPSGRNDFASFQVAGSPKFVVTDAGTVLLPTAASINFSSTADATAAADTGLIRGAANTIYVTQGSGANANGTFSAQNVNVGMASGAVGNGQLSVYNAAGGEIVRIQPSGASLGLGSNGGVQPLIAFGPNQSQIGQDLTIQRAGASLVAIGNARAGVASSRAAGIQSGGTGATNGEFWQLDSVSAQTTLSTTGTTTATATVPAGAWVLGVAARVTTTITTAANWSIKDNAGTNVFINSNTGLTAGSTAVGQTFSTSTFYASANTFNVVTNVNPGAGVVRVTIFYLLLSAPTQ